MTTSQHNPSADEGLVEAMALAGLRAEYRLPDIEAKDWALAFLRHLRIAKAALAAARSHGGM